MAWLLRLLFYMSPTTVSESVKMAEAMVEVPEIETLLAVTAAKAAIQAAVAVAVAVASKKVAVTAEVLATVALAEALAVVRAVVVQAVVQAVVVAVTVTAVKSLTDSRDLVSISLLDGLISPFPPLHGCSAES